MIKIENEIVSGWVSAIRGMRNSMNSWSKSDSSWFFDEGKEYIHLGQNDHDLMMKLAMAGPEHAKYRRMIIAWVDITAPLYFLKEFDTYKVGTVANSTSTMHKIHAKEFTIDDFSCEHLEPINEQVLRYLIQTLNVCREAYSKSKDKKDWWQMIQLLPSSYNQKRTVMLNYEVLANIYRQRKNHKLDEWLDFCTWIKTLPYSELITLEAANG